MQRIFVRVDGFILSLDRLSVVLSSQKISFYNGDVKLTAWIFDHDDSAEKVFEIVGSMLSDVVMCDNATTLNLNTYEVNELLDNFKAVKVLGHEFDETD